MRVDVDNHFVTNSLGLEFCPFHHRLVPWEGLLEKKIGRFFFIHPSYSQIGERSMDFLIFHPFSLPEPTVKIFSNLGLKSIIASPHPLKIDHFGFNRPQKYSKMPEKLHFEVFKTFSKKH